MKPQQVSSFSSSNDTKTGAARTLNVRKRDGRSVDFDAQRIQRAIEKAFRADAGLSDKEVLPNGSIREVERLAHAVVDRCFDLVSDGHQLEVEKIQDIVESELMKAIHHGVARRYILYREERRKARAFRGDTDADGKKVATLFVTKRNGARQELKTEKIARQITLACHGVEDRCPPDGLVEETLKQLFDGVRSEEIEQAMILAVKSHIERSPDYSYVAARLLLNKIYKDILPRGAFQDLEAVHRLHFTEYLKQGVAAERLTPALQDFDLAQIAATLRIERDQQFAYMGLQTIYDRYLLHVGGRRIETPQYFWMRVAMGLALNEGDQKTRRAIEFYDALSSFRFVSSTPTLFNSGTLHPQLSSCYLATVMDDLDNIFKIISDDAKLSKWAGGLGNDWTNVRATGARIKGTNGTSQGVIPFLKVANDTAVAVNQGGKRKGAMCAYLETWHLDIEDFLELRRNTGDERRRTHDMNTANWVPDLFMKRVQTDGPWTLFSPSDVKDLHDLYGAAFEKRFAEYEAMADRGEIKLFKRLSARELWRKMLTMLFETGHPWITFKDPSNIRSPQDHVGVVHCSNLCTEILLNTSIDETAVCNLGSINLPAHLNGVGLDEATLARTVRTAMRMLDNVIDLNFYPIPDARNANLKHRPVGLGIMGFQDAIYRLRLPYASEGAVSFADTCAEKISFYAILASTELAAERGPYETFMGSKWHRGLLPMDTIELLEKERGMPVKMSRTSTMDWSIVRASIKKNGMRNSNCMAIAPTATISNITGVGQSIEPTYKNLYAKSNLSGEFTSINTYLIEDLKARGLWDAEMVDDLKYFDGSIQEIERVPQDLKELYRTAAEIEPRWLIECASRRQKWIDMGQSLNLYLAGPNGRKLSEMYIHAWEAGLKTTYYLRTLAATQIEKSTMDVNRRGLQPRWMKNKSASANITVARGGGTTSVSSDSDRLEPVPPACSIDNPDCESCQ